jgi:hypothetical protein
MIEEFGTFAMAALFWLALAATTLTFVRAGLWGILLVGYVAVSMALGGIYDRWVKPRRVTRYLRRELTTMDLRQRRNLGWD